MCPPSGRLKLYRWFYVFWALTNAFGGGLLHNNLDVWRGDFVANFGRTLVLGAES